MTLCHVPGYTWGMAATNVEIGAVVGLSHSSISRIMDGLRLPSLAAMRRIELAFEWPLESQVRARETSTAEYARQFRERADRHVPSPA